MTLLHALNPRAVAILGASDNPIKAGGRPIDYMRRHGYAGRIFPINPNRSEVQGLPAYASLRALPEAPDEAAVYRALGLPWCPPELREDYAAFVCRLREALNAEGKPVVAALARLHTRLGRRVRVFKCGPDFLDPQIHAIASGAACQNVDLWMCGEADIAWRLAEAARDADLVFVEGVMGLYDGGREGVSSTAAIAKLLKAPVVLVLDVKSMGASASRTGARSINTGSLSKKPGASATRSARSAANWAASVVLSSTATTGSEALLRSKLERDCAAVVRAMRG